MYRGLLLSGVSGVGKSTMGDAVGRLLSSAGLVTAVVDTDALAQFGPAPPDGERGGRIGLHDSLKCANLAALWMNFQAAGANFIVVSAGIETVQLREAFTGCLVGCEVQLVRLVAPPETIRTRLRGRDTGETLVRHLRELESELAERNGEQAAADIEDFTVLNDDRPRAEIAEEIVSRASWR
ncbi:MAG TPA: AAA family ATPase [Kribbella sp.]|uniref:AAA family ATPase n=1 Tax=Kribbella sp. TaxID=1871183 RepID=UPI002D7749A6|nr:AAA family ATPase [Kribbella sp.]HET6292648.1 AAA family ATPase [Kribbella sp.]